mgnify:CR=1 FL=1
MYFCVRKVRLCFGLAVVMRSICKEHGPILPLSWSHSVNEVTIVESMDMALPKLYAAENGGRGGAGQWEDTLACCYK